MPNVLRWLSLKGEELLVPYRTRSLKKSKRLANTPPRSLLLAAWCPPVFGGHHFKPLAEDLPCQANAAP
ncbi:hypothetical protein KZ843_14175, partial [Pseudomonas aeruginosa]